MGGSAKGISISWGFSHLAEEIDSLLAQMRLRTVDVISKRSKSKVFVEVVLAKISSNVAVSPDTHDLEEASAVLRVFFAEHFRDQDFLLTLSSPGTQRRLKTLHELRLFRGRLARVMYRGDEDGNQGTGSALGTIGSVDENGLSLVSADGTVLIRLDSVTSAVLEG